MNEAWLKATRCSVSNDLFMVVTTSILIYDAAITLFDDPSPEGVACQVPLISPA